MRGGGGGRLLNVQGGGSRSLRCHGRARGGGGVSEVAVQLGGPGCECDRWGGGSMWTAGRHDPVLTAGGSRSSRCGGGGGAGGGAVGWKQVAKVRRVWSQTGRIMCIVPVGSLLCDQHAFRVLVESFFGGYRGGRTPTCWPHTAQSGKPDCRGPEAKPHPRDTPNTPIPGGGIIAAPGVIVSVPFNCLSHHVSISDNYKICPRRAAWQNC